MPRAIHYTTKQLNNNLNKCPKRIWIGECWIASQNLVAFKWSVHYSRAIWLPEPNHAARPRHAPVSKRTRSTDSMRRNIFCMRRKLLGPCARAGQHTMWCKKKKPYGSAHYVTQRTKSTDVRILNAVVRNLKTHGGLLAVVHPLGVASQSATLSPM
jgi:hypothetical protein